MRRKQRNRDHVKVIDDYGNKITDRKDLHNLPWSIQEYDRDIKSEVLSFLVFGIL